MTSSKIHSKVRESTKSTRKFKKLIILLHQLQLSRNETLWLVNQYTLEMCKWPRKWNVKWSQIKIGGIFKVVSLLQWSQFLHQLTGNHPLDQYVVNGSLDGIVWMQRSTPNRISTTSTCFSHWNSQRYSNLYPQFLVTTILRENYWLSIGYVNILWI